MPPTLTQDALLAVVDRAIPDSYLQPIRDIGPGYELYQGVAKIGERCSTAVDNFERDGYILSSRGGALATVPVTFYRTSAAAGAVTVLAGTIVRASRGGQRYRTLVDAPFGALDLEAAPVTAQAFGFGYEYNIAGPFVDPQGATHPGELDTIDLPLQSPIFGDPSILARNDAPADGLGRPATLDVLGAERNVERQTAETDERYRARIRKLPDTVTPAAILRQITNYFRGYPGLFWRHIETWKHEYQECFDSPEIPPTAFENYDSTMFVYDDPRPASPMRNRWLGENDMQGAFIVEVAEPAPIDDFSFVYDDPAGDATGVPDTVPTRALSAFDAPDTMAPPARAGAFDVPADFGIVALFAGLYALLDQIKAGGTFVAIHIQET